jgi:hypothetical protein
MSKIDNLLTNYIKYITVPWREAAPAQRVAFCVYPESLERTLRLKLGEFELATTQAGHNWAEHDISGIFSEWLTQQRYAEKYYKVPELLPTLLPKFTEYIVTKFNDFVREHQVDQDTVVAVIGVGSLFGFVKVKEVVDKIALSVNGRLVIFFPGSYENNNYRLLDGYDGWNYLAVPITPDTVL